MVFQNATQHVDKAAEQAHEQDQRCHGNNDVATRRGCAISIPTKTCFVIAKLNNRWSRRQDRWSRLTKEWRWRRRLRRQDENR